MTTLRRPFSFGAIAAVALVSLFALSAHAATLVIVNNDGAGEGFNDPTVVAPVGGNPGTTLGQQRLNLFVQAASIWGSILPSAVTIEVRSQFNPQTCNATSAVLGSAGPVTIHADFPGAIFAGTWYHQALANRLSGIDQSVANPDINATFNSTLDLGTCLGGARWYYGFDGNEGTNVELLPVLLHEMGHGLGFSTTTSGTSGNFNSGLPSVFDRFLYDGVTGLHWYQMTPAQRVASAISVDRLAWDGPGGIYGAAHFLGHKPRLRINSPAGIAGSYQAGAAAFGAALTDAGVTGDVVLVADPVAPTSDGCETPYTNAAALAGKIALLDRGLCTFVIKAQNAQAAGAIALLIANNTTGIQPPGGSDPSITIPVIGISQAEGNAIKANLAGGVNVTVGTDPAQVAGVDAGGRPLMFAPNPFQSGSSVSHYDVSLSPNALMEPAINNDLHDNVDITRHAFADIGWIDFVTATTLRMFTAEDRAAGILLTYEFSDLSDIGSITIERAPAAEGPWAPIQTEMSSENNRTLAFDTNVEAGATYHYRLSVTNRQGQPTQYGLIAARHAGPVAGPMVLMAPSPNPAPGRSTVTFRIANPEFVRLTIADATGRQVRSLHQGVLAPGEHSLVWDGQSDGGRAVPAGLYFISLGTSSGRATQRLAVVR